MSRQLSDTEDLVIKHGFPILKANFQRIKLITGFLTAIFLVDLIYSLKLFVSAVQIKYRIGYFINLVSSGDGDILPALQAVPVVFFIIINSAMIFLLYKCFDAEKKPNCNRFMFAAVACDSILVFVLFVIIICVMVHAQSKNEKLHDGITTAMKNYLNSTEYKIQIDHLQIEFQCCGSKTYDEWYSIQWFDKSLEEGEEGSGSSDDGNTPFSCCSMKSTFPCIHHNIELTGKAYLYTPEYNLSISTRGCFEMIHQRKKEIGWGVVGSLFLYLFFQILTLVGFRFIQTAHSENSRFLGNSHVYTIWFFGCYKGKVKKEAPAVPPVPDELKE